MFLTILWQYLNLFDNDVLYFTMAIGPNKCLLVVHEVTTTTSVSCIVRFFTSAGQPFEKGCTRAAHETALVQADLACHTEGTVIFSQGKLTSFNLAVT